MSNLVNHAKRELELIGEEPATIAGYLAIVQAFADMGHSGGSASVAIPTINALLQFQNLAPLTNKPDEWEDRSEISGYPIWQNKRNSTVFSYDGGVTTWQVSEGGELGDIPVGPDTYTDLQRLAAEANRSAE